VIAGKCQRVKGFIASFTFNWCISLLIGLHLAETIPFLDEFLSEPGSVTIPDMEEKYK